MFCLTDSWVSGWTAVISLGFSPRVIPRTQSASCLLHSAPPSAVAARHGLQLWQPARLQEPRLLSIRGIHCDLDTLLQLHLHRTGFFERKINSLSQRQQHSKILAKYCPWWVTLAELIWHLPENYPWIVIKILKCAHYLEDYSSCAVSS